MDNLYVWGFSIPLENCSLIWRRHRYRWRAANFDICSGFLTNHTYLDTDLPFHNDHLRGSVAFALILPKVWQWSCHYSLRLGLSRLGFEQPNSLIDCGIGTNGHVQVCYVVIVNQDSLSPDGWSYQVPRFLIDDNVQVIYLLVEDHIYTNYYMMEYCVQTRYSVVGKRSGRQPFGGKQCFCRGGGALG